jgi:DNA (cytosine-5)-methyltransferase 1
VLQEEKAFRRTKKIKVLDIFCGAGGFSQGFERAGFEVTGVDISEAVGKAFQLNCRSQFLRADLSKVLIKNGSYDIVIGGPPCRPWSAVNTTRRGREHRDYCLLSRFFQHVEYHWPEIFVLENVPLLANDKTLKSRVKRLNKEGYSVEGNIVKYSDYGAPTSRHRFILLGTRKGDAKTFFRKLHEHKRVPKTVRDVIWELKDKEKGEVPDHVWPELRTIRKYINYYETGKFGWYILRWDEPAPSFGNVMKTYILHPDAFNGKPERVISVKEALLIMGFGLGFRFPEKFGLGVRYQMAVDAVSPVFSYAAARVAREMAS